MATTATMMKPYVARKVSTVNARGDSQGIATPSSVSAAIIAGPMNIAMGGP